MSTSMAPQDWLCDSSLTEEGRQLRARYAQYTAFIDAISGKPYKSARAMHLLQRILYDVLPNGWATPPHTINLCVNNICNFKCAYCDLNHGRHHPDAHNTKIDYNLSNTKKRHELPLELCKRIVDETAWFHPTIRVPWTEPLLYPDLLPLIHYVKAKGLPFSMLTNGFLLPKFADQLIEADIDALRISLDGPEEVHNALCGVPNAYSRIMEGMTKLVEAKKSGRFHAELGCYFTLNDRNCHDMSAMVEDLDRRGLLDYMSVNFFMFNFISPDMVEAHNREHAEISGCTVKETSTNLVDISRIDIDAVLAQKEKILNIINERERERVHIHFRPDFTRENLKACFSHTASLLPNTRCDTFWHTAYINPDGALKTYPPCILPEAGNIREKNFMDVWNGETMRRQRALLREHKCFHGCSRCWSAYYSLEDEQNTWKL